MTAAQTIPALPLLERARRRVARLTQTEIDAIMRAAHQCMAALRQGRATEDHHNVVHTVVAIAEVIEHQGVITGLAQYWQAADAALQAIRARAMAGGTWDAPTLSWGELGAIDEALELHAWQLRQLSAGELHRAAKLLIARTQSARKPVERTTLAKLRAAGEA